MRFSPTLLTSLLLATSLPTLGVAQYQASPRDSAVHVLNRLAYGPIPGQVDRLSREGVWRWIDRQLDPGRIPDEALESRERQFSLLDYSRDDLSAAFFAFQREQRQRQQAMTESGDSGSSQTMDRRMDSQGRQLRQLRGQVGQLAVVRAVTSNRQLQEVMVDFWTNHFNVYLAKGLDRILLPYYIEETIRPHALGQFEDLLMATARDPAMLFYLDNVQSVSPGSIPPGLKRQLNRMGPGGSGPAARDSLLQRLERRMPQGLNENYARELLELHTLGVDGGYTQEDVIAVARIFTGWSLSRRDDKVRFQFNAWAHDSEEKVVLGQRFEAGGDQTEGESLLAFLANHPSTMHHVTAKLCARFVSDAPSPGCVDAGVEAWRNTRGNIGAVVRAIVASPEFWAAANQGTKVKTPLEFTVSAVRAVGGTPDNRPGLAQTVANLGQPLYLQAAPTGYPESQDEWVNSGALLKRMNVALALAGNNLPGVSVDLATTIPLTGGIDELVEAVNQSILAGLMTESTRQVIRRELADVPDPKARRILAVGLAIGGPEFQQQ